MNKFVIKGMILRGRFSGPADKYDDSNDGPTDYDVERTYNSINKFLESKGQLIIPEIVNPLPFIEEGIVGPSNAAVCYTFNKCLIANEFRPHIFNGIAHIVQVAAKIEDEHKIESIFDILKKETGWMWSKYWNSYGNKKIVNVQELLTEANQSNFPAVNYLPKLLV